MIRRIAILFILIWTALNAAQVRAQAGLVVQSNQVEMDFPNTLTFTLQAKVDDTVDEVYLEYGTNGRSCVDGLARQEAELSPGSPFKAVWEWDFKDSGSLPVGAEVWWQWEVRTKSGQSLRSDRQTFVVEDPNLTWQRIENDQVQVVWSEGDRSFARRILDLSTRSLDRLAKEAGIEPNGQIRLTIYPTFEDLRAARLFAPEWTGGVAFPEYGVTMLGVPVDSGDWMEDVVPHELAHLVTGQRVFNCLGTGMPTWLSEGLSMYAEKAEDPSDASRILAELEAGRLPPLRNLAGGFSANAEQTNISYAQSGEIVRFLVRENGPDKMAALLAAIQSGLRINPALLEVYSFDTDGLDNAWRVSLGFESAELLVTAAPTLERTAVPTLALWTSAAGGDVQPTETPEPTETLVEMAAAATDTPTLQSTDTPEVGGSGQETAPTGDSGGLQCFGGQVLLGGSFLVLIAPAFSIRRKRSRQTR